MLHSIRQFIEALQDPYGLTRTLGEIEVCRSSDGEPLRWVGNSAVVFKIRCGGRYKMLKCYTRPMEHLEAIYQEKLLRQELYVWQADGQGEWCDVVIDDWIEGITLYEAVMRGAGSGDKAHLSNLARQFDRLALELLESDWAHGDLKPENILLDESGTLRPVIIRKSKCSTDFKRNDFLKKNEAYPLGALRSLKFAYRKLRISLFVELAV